MLGEVMRIPFVLSAVALAASYGAALAAPEFGWSRSTNIALTVLAVASFAWFLFEEIRVVRGLDEMQRQIQLEALAIAFPLAILSLVTLGLLERFVSLPPEDLSYRHIWPFFVLYYFIGLAVAGRQYR